MLLSLSDIFLDDSHFEDFVTGRPLIGIDLEQQTNQRA